MMESEHTCSFKAPFCSVNCTPSDSRFEDSTGFRGFHCARTVLALHGHRSVNRKSKLRKRIIRIPPIFFEQPSSRPRSVFSYTARGVREAQTIAVPRGRSLGRKGYVGSELGTILGAVVSP